MSHRRYAPLQHTHTGLGGLSDIVEDTTPQLGGDLDLNGSDITGTGNIDITGDVGVSAGQAFNVDNGAGTPVEVTTLTDPTGTAVEHMGVQVASDSFTSTSYVDVTSAVISGASFTAGEEYLALCFSTCQSASTTSHGAGLKLTLNDVDLAGCSMTCDGNGSADTSGQPFGAMTKFTYSAGDLQLEGKSATGSLVYAGTPTLFAMNLTDLGEYNYRWSEDTTTTSCGLVVYALTSASVTVGNGSDDWLIFGHVQMDNFGGATRARVAVYDGTTYSIKHRLTQDDSQNTTSITFMHVVSAAEEKTYTIAGMADTSAPSDIISARLFAVKLNAFTDHSIATNDPTDPADGNEYTVLTDSFTAADTDNYAFWGSIIQAADSSAYVGGTEIHYQEDAGGYTDPATWSTDVTVASRPDLHANSSRMETVLIPVTDRALTTGGSIDVRMRHEPAPSFAGNVLYEANLVTHSWTLGGGETTILGDPDYPTRIDGEVVDITGHTTVDGNLQVEGHIRLTGRLDGATGIQIPTATTTQLTDKTDNVNILGKREGTMFFNTTTNKPVFASGPNTTDVWVESDGTTEHTPV